jgi:hypothetical protein
MFAEAYGIDISYWGWNPPTPPEPQVKIVSMLPVSKDTFSTE